MGMVVLVAAGLAVAAVATYEEQRSFLLDRVDQQVQSGLVPVAFELRLPGVRPTRAPGARRFPFAGLLGRRPPGIGPASLPPGTFGELIGPGGKVLRQRTFTYGDPAPAAPKLPAHLLLSHAGSPLRLFTVHASRGPDVRYRAAAFAVEGGDTVVVAVSLRETDDTLHRLVVVEGLVGGGVILALVLLGWVVIRIGLLPLERIGRVASEIARGDLSRRVSTTDQRTEVGRLGRSLNEMLGQIEQAFRARRQSEDQLRRFLADASHELRTPLASIRGYAELFRLGAADDPATLERAMARIEAEATRMGVLVEDLLSLTALDQAPERPRVPVDLGELAAHAAEDTRVTAPDRNVRLSVDEPATTVMGDPGQLGQLLANLMRNAVIHTPAGTTIEVAVRREGARTGGTGGTGGRCSRCATTGRAYPTTPVTSCSSASGAPRAGAAGARAVPVWDWRSSRRSPWPTVARSGPTTSPTATAGARCSASRSPRSRRRSPLSKISAFSRRTLIWITQIEPVTVRRAASAAA